MQNAECSRTSRSAFCILQSAFVICYLSPSYGEGGSTLLAKITAEYIWIDGQKPTAKLRSKTKILDSAKSLADIPEWGYDGSSTEQATGHFSDLLLRPVKMIPDPLHREGHVLVLCEVLNPD